MGDLIAATEFETPLLWNAEETCRQLGGISRRHLWNLTKNAGLASVPVGSRPMYEPAAVRAWIDEQKKSPTALRIHESQDGPDLATAEIEATPTNS